MVVFEILLEKAVLYFSYLAMDAFWIGMNDIVHEMSFVWDDKVLPTFAYWGKQQPDDIFGRNYLISENYFVFLKNRQYFMTTYLNLKLLKLLTNTNK